VPGLTALGGRERDGLLYVPAGRPGTPVPLMVALHGAGGGADGPMSRLRDAADEAGFVLLALDSRGRTWDAVLAGYGPDVVVMDRSLRAVFQRCPIDPSRIFIEGFSDGASYALGIGLANGDLFRGVIAFSPGFVPPGGARVGSPRFFVSHGTGDPILPIDRTSRLLVPELRAARLDVAYREFDGGHDVPPAISRAAITWMTQDILLTPEDPFWRAAAPDTARVRFETSKGSFVVELYRAPAPRGVDRLYNLVRAGFFDDSRFFRVVPDFIAQFGIPGDPAVTRVWQDRTFPDDPEGGKNLRGTVAFAMKGPDDRRTQLYINLRDNARNDGQGFAILGRVVEGMSVVDSLYAGYGEQSGGGMRAGRQQRLLEQGNAYLDREYPRLDRIRRASVIP
jgi:predicted esterase/cyclophilin family peptidyl-prolyl cis-trans isomerase